MDRTWDPSVGPPVGPYVALVLSARLLSAHRPVPGSSLLGSLATICRQAQGETPRETGNKKERVPEGPLSKPFGLSDRYEVSMTDSANIAVCQSVARGHIAAAIRNIPAAKVLSDSRMPAYVRLQIFLKTKKHDVRCSRAALA
jgi:hypothetical protein